MHRTKLLALALCVSLLALTVSASAQAVTVGGNCTISWTASTATDLVSYRVYGSLASTATPPVVVARTLDVLKPATSTTCAALGLTSGGTLSVQLDAVDALGNRSPRTVAVTATQDVSPPDQPTNITITPNP
jgi:hypothetical protein